MLIRILFASILTWTTARTHGQSDTFKFHHLDLELNSRRVESLLEDEFGYIWIGTLAGLHRYDGINLQAYLSGKDSTELRVSRIFRLNQDAVGRLWIGTEDGVYRYDYAQDRFWHYEAESLVAGSDNAVPDRIFDIVVDPNGTIWALGGRSGLQYFDESTSQFVAYRPKNLNHQEAIASALCISLDPSGGLWLGTNRQGLFRIDTESLELSPYPFDPLVSSTLKNNILERITVDRMGDLWLIADDNSIFRLSSREGVTSIKHYVNDPNYPKSLYNNRVDQVYEDSKGRIWTCNQNGGLHLYDPKIDGFHRFLPDVKNPGSLTSNAVRAVLEDRHGRLWVGSHLSGIDVYDPYLYKFDHYYQSNDFNSINNNVVRSFYEDELGNLWIPTDGGGLNHFDRSKARFEAFEFQSGSNSITSNAALSIDRDRLGRFWIGTWRGGINIFDPKTRKFSQPVLPHSIIKDVYRVFVDSKGNIWVGAYQHGLSIFDPEGNFLTEYKSELDNEITLGNDNILDIFEDASGAVWIGTEFNGLNRVIPDDFNNLTFERFLHDPSNPQSLASTAVNHIKQDLDGNIWVATEGGLCKFLPNSSSFLTYNTAHGLASDNMRSILVHKSGELWIGTARGLSRFDPVSEKVRNYSKADGLQGGEFSKTSALLLRTGEMAFGGFQGFNIFHPDSLADNPNPPKTILTGLDIFNEPVIIGAKDSPLKAHISLTDVLVLSHKMSVISLEFSGINFTLPENNRYAYRLIGFDDNWVYTGNRRRASFMNLEAGEYMFEVKSANNDGIWSEPTTLRIIVKPPWWNTILFRLLALALVIGLIIGFVRLRTISLLRNQKILEAEVEHRTSEIKKLNQNLAISEKMASLGVLTSGIAHEINNPLNFISGAAQKVFDLIEKERVNGAASPYLREEILGNLREILQVGIKRATQIVSSLRNFARDDQGAFESTDIINCLDDALMILRYSLKRQNIAVNRVTPEKQVIECLPGRITQVFVNLINNAIEAAGNNGMIWIEIAQRDDRAVIQIEDSGPGINEEDSSRLFDPFFSTKGEGTGLGLYIVYGIVKEHFGTIVSENTNRGTKFLIELPIHRHSEAQAV